MEGGGMEGGKNGEMEDRRKDRWGDGRIKVLELGWRNGKVEGWRDGKMEGWEDEGMEQGSGMEKKRDGRKDGWGD